MAVPTKEIPAFAVVVTVLPPAPEALPTMVTCGRLRFPEIAKVEEDVLIPLRKFFMMTVIW